MLRWLKSLFKVPEPAGPPQMVREIEPEAKTISQDGVVQSQGGWLIEAKEKMTVRLFEVELSGLNQCLVTYRAQLKSEDLQEGAYLEMWCRLPGRGEFFSRGLKQKIKGANDWGTYEIPFYLKKGQRPDLLKLNLAVLGPGKVWIKDIAVYQNPL
ncbi:MAG: hypothetical protein V1742_00210 [Pseudomonadota bacterium]